MHQGELVKSPLSLVYRRQSSQGLRLVHSQSRDTLELDEKAAALWADWPPSWAEYPLLARQLCEKGFAQQSRNDSPLTASAGDGAVFMPARRWVKWIEESGDLLVLYNTASMADRNPLLVLGPYGALCWRGILAGWTVGRIRREAWRVFGTDEVASFLMRLCDLRFVEGDTRVLGFFERPTVLKEFHPPDVQFQMHQSRVPWYCLWEVCRTCDLRCKVCYQPDFEHAGPSRDETTALVRSIVESGVFYVSLLGGEPLLRPDLEEIVFQLRSADVFTKIITNGQQLTRRRAERLAEAGLNLVEVSFDGLTADTHEASRGSGSFEAALTALSNVKTSGMSRAAIVWTIHSGNLSELPHLPKFLDGLGISECYLSVFKKTGLLGAKAPWLPPGQDDLDMVRATLAEWNTTHPALSISLLPGCSCGRTSVVVGAGGEVRVCSFSYSSAGSLLRRPLLDIWRDLGDALPTDGPVGFCRPSPTPLVPSVRRLAKNGGAGKDVDA